MAGGGDTGRAGTWLLKVLFGGSLLLGAVLIRHADDVWRAIVHAAPAAIEHSGDDLWRAARVAARASEASAEGTVTGSPRMIAQRTESALDGTNNAASQVERASARETEEEAPNIAEHIADFAGDLGEEFVSNAVEDRAKELIQSDEGQLP